MNFEIWARVFLDSESYDDVSAEIMAGCEQGGAAVEAGGVGSTK
jgi:hypothetical protein